MIRFIVFFLILLLNITVAHAQHITINEVMSSNGETVADEDGDFEDWIELYNAGENMISLNGWGLSDSDALSDRYKWVFPDITLMPGEFLLVWASGKNRRDPAAPLHTNFSISQDGEPLVLTDLQGTVVDEIPPVEIPRDMSYGRSPDGSANLVYFDQPTPGSPNGLDGIDDLLPLPEFSKTGGFYPGPFELDINLPHEDPDAVILYTLDGSLPTPEHLDTAWYSIRYELSQEITSRPIVTKAYQKPLTITDRSDEENDISNIANSYRRHTYPGTNVVKATTIRAAVYKDDRVGPVSTQTYFVGSRFDDYRHLPVFSIITQEDGLFGYDDGILVPGTDHNYESDSFSGNYMRRGRDSEREARGQYFLPDGELALDQNMGIRIHGGTSRYYANKSFRLYARADYGDRFFEYPFFDDRNLDRFKRLKLRNAGQDMTDTYIRDGLISTLMLDTHVDIEAFHPVQLFINGEYWGILNFRERFDRFFVQDHYGVDEQDVETLDSWHETNDHFQEFRDSLMGKDPESSDYFEKVSSYIDVLSLFDLRIADIFFGRWDIHHWRVWRDRSDPESRWRWNLWDMDMGMGFKTIHAPEWEQDRWMDANYLKHFLTDYRIETHNREFQQILQNQQARSLFINRFADHLNTRFEKDFVLGHIDGFYNHFEPVFGSHIDRWRPPNGIRNFETWQENVDRLREFATVRPEHVTGHILDFFELNGTADISVERESSCGRLWVNTVRVSTTMPNPWNASYFEGNEIKLKAETWDGCPFLGWEVDNQWVSDDLELIINPQPDMQIRALYNNVVSAETELPRETTLMPNYPNPFNARTVIPFKLESQKEIKMTIYDALGRKIADVASGIYNSGSHEVYWDAEHVASGVYMVILEASGQRLVRKMLLIK